jgi:hypothetical protein
MSFYTCFDWFKKLRLFVNERNLRIDVVLEASRAVVIRWFSIKEAHLVKFLYSNSDYVSWLKISQVFKDWSQFLFGSWRNNLNQVVHNGLRKGVYNLLRIDVVLEASRAVVIRWFSIKEAHLGLFKFISDYLPCFERIKWHVTLKLIYLIMTFYWEVYTVHLKNLYILQ